MATAANLAGIVPHAGIVRREVVVRVVTIAVRAVVVKAAVVKVEDVPKVATKAGPVVAAVDGPSMAGSRLISNWRS